jgi:hypothetical protein
MALSFFPTGRGGAKGVTRTLSYKKKMELPAAAARFIGA